MSMFYFNGGYLYEDPTYSNELIKIMSDIPNYTLLKTMTKLPQFVKPTDGIDTDSVKDILLHKIKEGRTSLATVFNILQTFYNPLLHLNDIVQKNEIILDSNYNIIFKKNHH